MNQHRLAALVTVALIGASLGCRLPPYESGAISCVTGDVDDRACPDGFQCLDPKQTGETTCIEVGCGDGQVNPAQAEECDDANANDADLCGSCRAFFWNTGLVVGLGAPVTPVETNFGRPTRVDVDREGNVFFSALGSFRIWRLAEAATRVGAGDDVQLTPFAGNGSLFEAADETGANPNDISATFVGAIEADNLGNVFVADFDNRIVRRVDVNTGLVVTVAGGRDKDTPEFERPVIVPGPATEAELILPLGIAVDGDGDLFIADAKASDGPGLPGGSVHRVDARTGDIKTLLGPGGTGLDDRFDPIDVDFDEVGRLYVLDAVGFNGAPIVRIFDLDAADEPQRSEFFPLSDPLNCPVTVGEVRNRSLRLAVAPQGDRVFFAHKRNVWELAVPSGRCTRISANVDDPALLDLTDLALVVARDPGTAAAVPVAIVVSDLGSGVVTQVPLRGDDRIDGAIAGVVDVIAEDVNVGAGFDAASLEEVVLQVARQSDGRVTVNPTLECQPDPETAVLTPELLLERTTWEFLVTSPDLNKVISIGCGNKIAELAGSGVAGDFGDFNPNAATPPVPAGNAQLRRPASAVSDLAGNVYIADRDNHRIRRVRTLNGVSIIETLIGTGVAGNNGLDHDLDEIQLNAPFGLSFIDDEATRLLVADSLNHRILLVDLANEVVTQFIGTGEIALEPEEDVPAASARLNEPGSLVFLDGRFVDPAFVNTGFLLFPERGTHRVRQVLVLNGVPGVVSTLAGSTIGDVDGAGADARFRNPRAMMLGGFVAGDGVDDTLVVFVIDAVDRVRRLNVTFANLSPVAVVDTFPHGDGEASTDLAFSDGSQNAARFASPSSFTFLDAGHLLVADQLTGTLRRVTLGADGSRIERVDTVVGLPEGFPPDVAVGPDTQQVLEVRTLRSPAGVVLQQSTEPAVLYVSEAGDGVIRRVFLVDPDEPATWTTDVLGTDGAALVFGTPEGLALDESDPARATLFVADSGAHVVRAVVIDASGTVVDDSVYAGVSRQRGFVGDDGSAGAALLNGPSALAVSLTDPAFLYIADVGNDRVRRVSISDDAAARTVVTVLGNGAPSSGGEGAPASSFSVQSPGGMDIDAAGNLLVTSVNTLRFLQADDDGIAGRIIDVPDVDAVATLYGRDRTAFPESVTRCLSDVAFAPDGTGVYVLDACLGLLLRLDRERAAP